MGEIDVKQFNNTPLETLRDLPCGDTWTLDRQTPNIRFAVAQAMLDHENRLRAYAEKLGKQAELEEKKREKAIAMGKDPDAVAPTRTLDEVMLPLDCTIAYQKAAVLACHLTPKGLDPLKVLEELGEPLINYLQEKVNQEYSGDAAKNALRLVR